MNKLEEKIGYGFKNRELLTTALTHSSYTNERHDCIDCYERLEFLGDSILSVVTAEFLYNHRPKLPEGRMTKLRAELVCEVNLHKVALALDIGSYMRVGKGEERTGGRERPSILADMVESIIAAIYLDSGFEEAKKFIIDKLLKDAKIDDKHRSTDYKTALQEYIQRKPDCSIKYELLSESGPDHDKTFTFCVLVNDEAVGEGTGKTKKEAEQVAAMKALEALKK